MPSRSIGDRYDSAVADLLVTSGNDGGGGLPAFLGIRIIACGPGTLHATAVVNDDLLTPFGNAHGGVIAGIVDHVTGAVVYPLLERGQWAATTEIKTNYIAPVRAGTINAAANVLAITNRSAIIRAELYYAERLVAAAQATLTIVDPR